MRLYVRELEEEQVGPRARWGWDLPGTNSSNFCAAGLVYYHGRLHPSACHPPCRERPASG